MCCVHSPVKIVVLFGNKRAIAIDCRDEESTVSLEFLGCAKIGDHVFVQNGFALQKVEPKKAECMCALLDEIDTIIRSAPPEVLLRETRVF